MDACVGSESAAHGVRIRVEPFHVDGGAAAYGCNHLFGYSITIDNLGPEPVQLLWRRWLIVDDLGRQREVTGAGVVGEQPLLPPGGSFTYQSACPLETPKGSMEGAFTFQRPDESLFEVPIDRFTFAAPPAD